MYLSFEDDDEESMSLHDDGPTADEVVWFLATFEHAERPMKRGDWQAFQDGMACSFEGRLMGIYP